MTNKYDHSDHFSESRRAVRKLGEYMLNCPRGSYTCCSFDNNLWNVDTLLNNLRKKQPV